MTFLGKRRRRHSPTTWAESRGLRSPRIVQISCGQPRRTELSCELSKSILHPLSNSNFKSTSIVPLTTGCSKSFSTHHRKMVKNHIIYKQEHFLSHQVNALLHLTCLKEEKEENQQRILLYSIHVLEEVERNSKMTEFREFFKWHVFIYKMKFSFLL